MHDKRAHTAFFSLKMDFFFPPASWNSNRKAFSFGKMHVGTLNSTVYKIRDISQKVKPKKKKCNFICIPSKVISAYFAWLNKGEVY